jgi:hypothetical protein
MGICDVCNGKKVSNKDFNNHMRQVHGIEPDEKERAKQEGRSK